jgi:hypothetical protein
MLVMRLAASKHLVPPALSEPPQKITPASR